MITFLIIFILLNNVKSEEINNKPKTVCGIKPVSKGECGDNCKFTYYHNEKKLLIQGDKINNYTSHIYVPWKTKKNEI